jgi:homocysteine S-methyltransferase
LDRERIFIGDGGVETTMIFDVGIELPLFASFLLLGDRVGTDALRTYYRSYLALAHRYGVGFTLDTPTWRASRDWGQQLGYSPHDLAEVNRAAVRFGEQIRAAEETDQTPIAVCGTIGPRGDAYDPVAAMSPQVAEQYHATQIQTFAEAGADMVSAYTLAYAEEAIGIVRAATASGIPVSISFTIETDGLLPSGQSVGDAIGQVDAATGGAPAYFMINCAHPTHFGPVVKQGGAWLARLGGVRANASAKSHAELDQATELDSGDPDALGAEYRALKPYLGSTRVLGGCCGTNALHVARICEGWLS